MAAATKQDSNSTGLRYAEEASIGTLGGSPIWYPLEPNSYDDFGGEIVTLARNPINASRQRKKGVVVDVDSAGGFNTDLTLGLQELLQGFMFADMRRKGEEVVTAVDIDGANPDEYEVASTTGFFASSLIFGSGFTNTENNGLKLVTAIVADTSVEVADGGLVAEASPPAAAKIVVVGYQGDTGDIDVDASLVLPALTSTTLDFTTLGLTAGEWIFIGGDTAGTKFGTAANNGFARIYTIAANRLVFDKTQSTMVTEANTTGTIRLFFGRMLKNESDVDLITRRTYQLERTLGAEDTSLPSEIQSEYLVGAVPNELTFTFGTADKVMLDLAFLATDHEQRSGATGVKSGTRPAIVAADAFNTTSDFSRLKMSVLDRTTGANPTALFAFVTEFSITINNNVSPNKAISVMGAFDMTAGQFAVGGSVNAYFADIAAVQAVRNNSDVTIDFALVKDNAGMVVDLPLLALGDGRASVEQDQPIMLELSKEAAADEVFDTTLIMVFFDYLPDAAE